MKALTRFSTLTSLLTLCATLSAATAVRYEAEPGSKAKVDGTSTVHDWTVESGIIGGFMEADATFDGDSLKSIKILKAEATIPVRSLKSGKKRMDEVMQEAMKFPQVKTIEYKLANLEEKKAPSKPGVPFQFEATGLLTVSGVTRTNKMQVSIEALDKKRIKVSGDTAVKMTHFGIKPPAPTIALGLIKTGDDVKVHVEWMTAPAAEKK
jgi:polyisoprenoid-binding protein YceI